MAHVSYAEIPKVLDTHPRYASLSVDARYLYAHMRDTLKLSIRNNWQDERGFYIRMARVSMAALLHRSLPKVLKVVRELIDAGLLREKREGLTRSNRLYVQMVEGEDEMDFQCRVKKVSSPDRKPDCTPDRNGSSPNHPHPTHPYPSKPKNRRWFIKAGDIWMDEAGKLWQFDGDDIVPFHTVSETTALVHEILAKSAS